MIARALGALALVALTGLASGCVIVETSGQVQLIDAVAVPPAAVALPEERVAIEPTRQRAFEEIGILTVLARSTRVRDKALRAHAAKLGASAVIDIESAGKVPYLYFSYAPVGYKTLWVATAIRWLPEPQPASQPQPEELPP